MQAGLLAFRKRASSAAERVDQSVMRRPAARIARFWLLSVESRDCRSTSE
jgi:hypothetical protein